MAKAPRESELKQDCGSAKHGTIRVTKRSGDDGIKLIYGSIAECKERGEKDKCLQKDFSN